MLMTYCSVYILNVVSSLSSVCKLQQEMGMCSCVVVASSTNIPSAVTRCKYCSDHGPVVLVLFALGYLAQTSSLSQFSVHMSLDDLFIQSILNRKAVSFFKFSL